ncbi:MAG: DUF1538 domain-containing protein [Syntrophomonadaceae bacterium]
MSVLIEKLKDVILSVLPITVIVLILNFTITPIETNLLIKFLLGAVFIIVGLSIFLFGIDIGISPLSKLMGYSATKTNKAWVVALAGLILGFFITIAEPDLLIFAGQVDAVSSGVISKLGIVVVVSIGIAVLLAIGLLRIVFDVALHKLLTILYLIILALALFTSPEFIAISFDASAATTGVLTVPFVLGLALGVSSLEKSGIKSEEDSFGLVAITATGAIITVMIMSAMSKVDKITGSLETHVAQSSSIIAPFISKLGTIAGEILIALLPLVILFFIFQKVSFKLSHKSFNKILKGLSYAYIGLVLFLVGVNAGFMNVGSVVGHSVASLEKQWIVIAIGFILGIVIVLAEPAVYVLTNQIEDVTSGSIKRTVVIVALSLGVGLAVVLSMVRIAVPGVQLWHYLLPGYAFAILLSYVVPKLFVGIAFDAGCVATGPMTATFILAFSQGAAEAIEGANVLVDGFGVIAMAALMPIITLQILGVIFKIKQLRED